MTKSLLAFVCYRPIPSSFLTMGRPTSENNDNRPILIFVMLYINFGIFSLKLNI